MSIFIERSDSFDIFEGYFITISSSSGKIRIFRNEEDEITDLLEKNAILEKFLSASEKAEQEKQEFETRMITIDHTSLKADFDEKCRWLASQGRGNELAKLLQARKSQNT